MHMGYDPQGLIQEADLVVVLDADVPWIPNEQQPRRRLPLRHHRRGPGVPPLPDAQLPERPRHHFEHLERAGSARAGDGQALRSPRHASAARRTRAAEFNRKRNEALAEASVTPSGDKINFSLSQPADRRDGGRGCRDLQRVFDGSGALSRATKPDTFYGLRPPAASAGASARRSAPSSQRLTSSWSRRLATAPTCSPTRWSPIGSRTCTSCRS